MASSMTTVRVGSTPSSFARHQKGIRGGLAGKMLRVDRVAIDLHLEEVVQLGGLHYDRAVLT